MEPTITRTIELAAPAREVWRSLADAEGLAAWLGDAVDLEVAVGAAGRIVDGGAVRRVVVAEVDEGRSIGFTWWDEAAPEAASTVTIEVHGDEASSTVTVTEAVAGGAMAHLWDATPADVVGLELAAHAWDGRLAALAGLDVVAPASVW